MKKFLVTLAFLMLGSFVHAQQPVRVTNQPTVTTVQATGSNLHVVCDSGCSSSTAPADNSTFTYSSTSQSPVGCVFNSSVTNLTSGNMGAIGCTTGRKIFTALFGNAGAVMDAAGQNATQPANWLSIGCGFNTSPTTVSSGNGSPCQMDNAGNLKVNIAAGGSAVDANNYAIAAPAASATSTLASVACNILSAASTNSTSCKGSAGNFYGFDIYNTTTTVYYLRLYNTASAPTCSSATGFIRSIPIPPAGAAGQVGGAISNQNIPVNYTTGIGYCITGGSSSTDNTNAATGVFGEIRYK